MDESFKKEVKYDAPTGSDAKTKKKSIFTPPDLDVNVTIDTIKTNNNVITDLNKIKDIVNESIQEDKISKIIGKVDIFKLYLFIFVFLIN